MRFIYTALLVSLCAIGLAYLAYRIYLHTFKKEKHYLENNEFKNRANMKSNLLFFYADYCDHCQSSKPIWENVKNDVDFEKFNLNFIDIDGENEKNNELLKNYNIKEYPTIILDRDNKKYIFDANLETETLMKFLTTVYS